ADAGDAFAEVEAIKAVAVGFVVLETDERQRADVHFRLAAVGLLNVFLEADLAVARRLETETVAIVFAGDVAGERIETVGPPEAGAFVLIERQHLLGEDIALEGLHGEIAVKDVVDFGAVFEEETVPHALKADAIAHDHVVGAVDGHEAIAAVPDGS